MKTKVAIKSEVPKGKAKQIKIGDLELALFHTESDEWFVTSDICSHEYCNLGHDGGKLDGYEVECDCHGSKFDIRTGNVLLPPAFEPIKTFKLIIKGEDIYIDG